MLSFKKNKTDASENNSICTPGDYSELSKIRDFVTVQAKKFGFPDDDVLKIALAVDEACTNLIEHAFKFDKAKELCVNIESDTNQFIVNIIDNGSPFNPLEVIQPDMKEYLSKYSQGGLGIFIMRSVMDEISYSPSTINSTDTQQHLNILKLKKILH